MVLESGWSCSGSWRGPSVVDSCTASVVELAPDHHRRPSICAVSSGQTYALDELPTPLHYHPQLILDLPLLKARWFRPRHAMLPTSGWRPLRLTALYQRLRLFPARHDSPESLLSFTSVVTAELPFDDIFADVCRGTLACRNAGRSMQSS